MWAFCALPVKAEAPQRRQVTVSMPTLPSGVWENGDVELTRTRGDYRMRRSWPGWTIERRWGSGWTQVGGRMSSATAHALLFELSDWQSCASQEASAMMRGEIGLPAAS